MAGILDNDVLITRFVAPISVISNQPVFVSDTLSLKRQVNSQNVQRWEIQTKVEPSTSSADFFVHNITSGYDTVVEIQMPQVYRSKATDSTTSTSNIQVNGAAAAGSSSVIIDNNNGTLTKGEFISFSNHDKVYLVTSNRVEDGSLSIFPPLVSTVPDNTIIKYGNNVVLKARYNTDVILGITYTDGIMSDPGVLTFIEAL